MNRSQDLRRLRKTKRDLREKSLLQGINLCYLAHGRTEGLNPDEVLKYVFLDSKPRDSSKSKARPIYGSIQTLAALMNIYNLQITVSDELTSDMVSMIKTLLGQAKETISGFPMIREIDEKTFVNPFEIRIQQTRTL